MKIIYILPSITIRGSNIIFEQVRGLANKGHEVLVTSLDDFKGKVPDIIPVKLDVARKEFESADAIIGYNPVCAFYVSEIEDTKARKYCLLLNDEREYYTKEHIETINKISGVKLDIEYEKQRKFIEASYELPLHYLVSNKQLEQELSSRKRKVTIVKTSVNTELFYPEEYIPKTDTIRIITDGNTLPWQHTDLVSRALAELHGYELWTFGNGKVTIRVDKHWGEINEDMLRKVLSSSHIFINMASIDGTGEMNLKAMQTGCVVVTRMTSGNEDVCQDGKNCIIIDGKSDEELAKNLTDKVRELINNRELRETIVRGGLETAPSLDIDNLEKGLRRK